MRYRLMRNLLWCSLILIGARSSSQAADKLAPRSGVDATGFDKAVRPEDDFFRYVNGGWIERTEIPADRAIYGSFIALRDKSESNLRAILEESAARVMRRELRRAQAGGPACQLHGRESCRTAR